MSDDAGVALLAHVDAVHLDDALTWMETRHGCHGAWRETETSEERLEDATVQVTVGCMQTKVQFISRFKALEATSTYLLQVLNFSIKRFDVCFYQF